MLEETSKLREREFGKQFFTIPGILLSIIEIKLIKAVFAYKGFNDDHDAHDQSISYCMVGAHITMG